MSTHLNKLNATKVAALIKANKQGRHGDGGGLYLQINGGSSAWIFRFIRHGRERQLGLGPAHAVALAEARVAAQKHRASLARNEDPQQLARERREAPSTAMTFAEAAAQFLPLYRQGLRNEKHRDQWGSTLEKYAFPKLGDMPVGEITLNHVLRVLEPIWAKKPDQANRVRARIQKVLSFAKVKGWRSGENPAAWGDNLEHVLPSVSKVHTVRHHPALDYREIPEFMWGLRQQNGVSPRALEFLILNVARCADIVGVRDREDKPPLRWSDINFKECVWTIPKSKASSLPHKKPLAPRSMAILTEMRAYRLDDVIVFPSLDRPGQALSASAMRSTLRKAMERSDITVHGFRACFRTWGGETTATPVEVLEASLAHGIIKSKTESAYRRADFFEKRRKLMEAWALYANSGTAMSSSTNVVPLR